MFITKYEKHLYATLRIVTGFLFFWHGSQKLFDFPFAEHDMPMYVIFIAGLIEFLGGLLIMIGLWTRWVAFIASGEMAYAYWSAHGTFAILPIMNHGELAMLYCFILLYISARGSGMISINHYLKRKKYKASNS